MKRFATTIALVAAALVLSASESPAASKPGRTDFLVNDYANLLLPEQKADLETWLRQAHRNSPKVEIVISTFPDARGQSAEDFIRDYMNRWRGWYPFEKDRRIHLIIILDPGTVRLGIGVPLLRYITPARAQRIVQEAMLPRFDESKVYEGLNAGVEEILAALAREAVPALR